MRKVKDRWYEATKRDSEREFEAQAFRRAAEVVAECVVGLVSAAVAVAGMFAAAAAVASAF